MPTCNKCGEVATILYKSEWWCLRHFKLKKEAKESKETALEKDLQKLPGYKTHPQTDFGKESLEQVFDETGLKIIE